jgi:formylglycine-generating enzyme required for sulfatase activity
MRAAVLAGMLITLGGCGAGTGIGSGAGPGTQVDATRAPWQVVDLDSGVATPLAAEPDLADPSLTDQRMLFRLVGAGPVAVYGQAPGTFARQADETLRNSRREACYIAVFETTRAQWQRLAGTTPWTTTSVAAIDGGGPGGLPASGLGLAMVEPALTAWNSRSRSGTLAIPSDDVWEAAARAGGAATYPWGEARTPVVTALHAVTWEVAPSGPAVVGGRLPNAFGLHDVAGNVWELTASGAARGGSWADTLALARPANQREVPEDGWATVGVRLTWRP